jgi:hypothetical protein
MVEPIFLASELGHPLCTRRSYSWSGRTNFSRSLLAWCLSQRELESRRGVAQDRGAPQPIDKRCTSVSFKTLLPQALCAAAKWKRMVSTPRRFASAFRFTAAASLRARLRSE